MERPGQHLAALGQLPGTDVDVPVGAQHVEHPVEVLTEGAGLAGDTTFDVGDLACHPVGLTRGAQLGAEIRIVFHGVHVRHATGAAGRTAIGTSPRRALDLGLPQALRDLVAPVPPLRSEAARKLDRTDEHRLLFEFIHRDRQVVPTGVDHRQPDAALAVGGREQQRQDHGASARRCR